MSKETMMRLIATILFVGTLLVPSPAHGDDYEVVYVAPDGDDDNPGTIDAPYATLGGASAGLCERDCDGLGRDVIVKLTPGVYTGFQGVWEYSDPNYVTRIIGYGAVMDGEHETAYGVVVHPSNDRSNIEWRSITWTRFTRAGINQNNGGGDLITANRFNRIGSRYSGDPGMKAWGGILWVGVQGSTVQNSGFQDIVNVRANGGYGHEHGVYLIRSSGNRIVGNRFKNVGGDPVRVRDRSNSNTVSQNTFTRSGSRGYLGDWRCLKAKHPCPDGYEGPSVGNRFVGNRLEGPHPWHGVGFRAVFCYDTRAGVCTKERVRTR